MFLSLLTVVTELLCHCREAFQLAFGWCLQEEAEMNEQLSEYLSRLVATGCLIAITSFDAMQA